MCHTAFRLQFFHDRGKEEVKYAKVLFEYIYDEYKGTQQENRSTDQHRSMSIKSDDMFLDELLPKSTPYDTPDPSEDEDAEDSQVHLRSKKTDTALPLPGPSVSIELERWYKGEGPQCTIDGALPWWKVSVSAIEFRYISTLVGKPS